MANDAAGVVAVDLDGTLVLGNSFHEFMAALWRHGGLTTRCRLLTILLRRAASQGVAARQSMKLRVVDLYSGLPHARGDRVLNTTLNACLSQLSQPVCALVSARVVKGWRIVLATAAPAVYADVLAARLGFDACLASPESIRPDDELIGQRKAAAVQAWVEEGSAGAPTSLLVVTDHLDDLPLLAIADEIALQCPAAKREIIETKLERRASHVFDPFEAQTGGGLWLWLDDSPSGPHDVWEIATILSKHRYALLYIGAGIWQRVLPGSPLTAGVCRNFCPTPPVLRQRIAIMLRRVVVRDRLGVFH